MHMVKFAITTVGAERLVFGTDYPFNPSHDQRTVRALFEALDLEDAQKTLICGHNISKFLKIGTGL